MATTTQVEKSEQEAREAYQEATAMMWEMAKNNPLIDALMREDQDEVDRLTEQKRTTEDTYNNANSNLTTR